MTENERRTEGILNKLNQTAADLPTQYSFDELDTALKTAYTEMSVSEDADPQERLDAAAAYICYLSDLIDRLEWAADNASGTISMQQDALDALNAAIAQKIPTATWLKIDGSVPEEFVCSSCFQRNPNAQRTFYKSRFCANCGAAMTETLKSV